MTSFRIFPVFAVYRVIKAKKTNRVFLPSGCQIVLCREQQWAPLYPTIDGQNLVVGHGFKPKKKLNCVILKIYIPSLRHERDSVYMYRPKQPWQASFVGNRGVTSAPCHCRHKARGCASWCYWSNISDPWPVTERWWQVSGGKNQRSASRYFWNRLRLCQACQEWWAQR